MNKDPLVMKNIVNEWYCLIFAFISESVSNALLDRRKQFNKTVTVSEIWFYIN